MKYRLLTILLVLALLTMAGCSASGAARTLDAAEEKIENKLDAAEDKVEDAVRKAVTPSPGTTPSQSMATPTEPAPSKTVPAETASAAITKEDAEKIALDYAGFTAGQVTRLRTEHEIDDGIPQFDVEFHEGDWEYEFEIHAETGKILSFDKDHKYD